MCVAGSQIRMQSATVSLLGFLPVRVGTVAPAGDPDEVCELGGISFLGPVEPSPVRGFWPVADVGDVGLPSAVVAEVPVPVAPGPVPAVPPELDMPGDVDVPGSAGLPGVPVVDVVEPCVGGRMREGGNTSEFERELLTGPLGMGCRDGEPGLTVPPPLEDAPGPVVPDVPEVPPGEEEVWASAVPASRLRRSAMGIAVRIGITVRSGSMTRGGNALSAASFPMVRGRVGTLWRQS